MSNTIDCTYVDILLSYVDMQYKLVGIQLIYVGMQFICLPCSLAMLKLICKINILTCNSFMPTGCQ